MTPGFAKTRQELPWLYYPENDSVLINAHSFGGAFSPAVNGKMPVAAWIPSRDDAGNGTTTLTDLVGSNNGTLTNMDAATDWVADTDSGGVRALDFDGLDDFVDVTDNDIFSFTDGSNDLPFSISSWIYPRSISRFRILCRDALAAREFQFTLDVAGKLALYLFSGGNFISRTASSAITLNNWHHVVCTYDGSKSAGGIKLYLDGSRVDDTTATSGPYAGQRNRSQSLTIGSGTNFHANGGIDDSRIWNVALDAADIAALATGRGVDVA